MLNSVDFATLLKRLARFYVELRRFGNPLRHVAHFYFEVRRFDLSYLILSYLILSYLILSYLILSYLVLSYLSYVVGCLGGWERRRPAKGLTERRVVSVAGTV